MCVGASPLVHVIDLEPPRAPRLLDRKDVSVQFLLSRCWSLTRQRLMPGNAAARVQEGRIYFCDVANPKVAVTYLWTSHGGVSDFILPSKGSVGSLYKTLASMLRVRSYNVCDTYLFIDRLLGNILCLHGILKSLVISVSRH